jgi:hypothetical protein
VKGGSNHGEHFIVEGVEACLARNKAIRKMWQDDEKILDASEDLLSGPFKGKSEI